MEFVSIVSDVTAEIDLSALLKRVMEEATRMLNADRATLFLNDEKTNELFSRVAMGEGIGEIRLPNTAGIAGSVFTSGETMNIPYAYADLRFNPDLLQVTIFPSPSMVITPLDMLESMLSLYCLDFETSSNSLAFSRAIATC